MPLLAASAVDGKAVLQQASQKTLLPVLIVTSWSKGHGVSFADKEDEAPG